MNLFLSVKRGMEIFIDIFKRKTIILDADSSNTIENIKTKIQDKKIAL
jgi:hypothetical protein